MALVMHLVYCHEWRIVQFAINYASTSISLTLFYKKKVHCHQEEYFHLLWLRLWATNLLLLWKRNFWHFQKVTDSKETNRKNRLMTTNIECLSNAIYIRNLRNKLQYDEEWMVVANELFTRSDKAFYFYFTNFHEFFSQPIRFEWQKTAT